MNQKKETTVSDVFARRSVWVKVRRGLAVPFVALAMVSGLLLMLRQPVTTAAAATPPSTTPSGATLERTPTANILYVTATANGTLCTIADPSSTSRSRRTSGSKTSSVRRSKRRRSAVDCAA